MNLDISKTETILWEDLLHEVDISTTGYRIDFKVYPVCLASDGKTKEVLYYDKDSKCFEPTNDKSKAYVFIDGEIKWDGCSNILFPSQERCMLHFCDRESARVIGKVLDRLYDYASDNIENYDD